MNRKCLAQRRKERKNSQPENKISGIIMGYVFSLRTRLEAPTVGCGLARETVLGLKKKECRGLIRKSIFADYFLFRPACEMF